MNAEHIRKREKYVVADVVDEVKRLTDAQLDITVVGVVFNWRGIMASESIRELLLLGMCRADLENLCLTVVKGGAFTHRVSQLSKGRLPGGF